MEVVLHVARDVVPPRTKEELCHRFDLFASGPHCGRKRQTVAIRGFKLLVASAQMDEKRAAAACRRVQMGEVTRARQCWPQEVQRDIPREVLESHPRTFAFNWTDRKVFLNSLKSAPRGSSPGPGDAHTRRVLLDDVDNIESFQFRRAFTLAKLLRF